MRNTAKLRCLTGLFYEEFQSLTIRSGGELTLMGRMLKRTSLFVTRNIALKGDAAKNDRGVT